MSRLSALQARYDGPIPADEKRAAIAADAFESRFWDFHNALRILMSIDGAEFIKAVYGDAAHPGDDSLEWDDWQTFRHDPYLWLIKAPTGPALEVYRLVEQRQAREGK